MEKCIVELERGTTCSKWNSSGTKLATGSSTGSVTVFGYVDPHFSSSTTTTTFKVSDASIVKVVWHPEDCGVAVAVISGDGTLSLWEESVTSYPGIHKKSGTQATKWRLSKDFGKSSNQVLDVAFRESVSLSKLILVSAYSDGNVKIYEEPDEGEFVDWQLQAEFQNVADSVSKHGKAVCLSASISWVPEKCGSQQLSFAIGFNSNVSQLNSTKVWEFDEDHQRWLPVAELASSGDQNDPVYAVSWAPNIGRPYEIIATATNKGIAIWHIGLNPGHDGRLSVKKVASFCCHDDEVWELAWDMSGMTLATTGSKNVVKFWQSNLNGVWHQQAILQPIT